jgi:gamma-glutamyltranspeptidase/glutathione hydrolase
MAERLHEHSELLARFESTRAAFFTSEDKPYCEGQLLRQPDLAASYRAIAEHGPDWFYLGPFARRTSAWMDDHGGILQSSDFARYRARERTPIETTYRGYTIIGFPPPSSGGIHVAQILNILERFDLKKIYRQAPDEFTHIVAEAMKLAFADRAHWLGDADFVNVPRGLIDKRYATFLAGQIDPESVARVSRHGTPPNWQGDIFGKHTTHIATADGNGNWVAITATINTSFGSKVVVPGTGIVLNNEMDDFSIAPGVPNAFGLIGAESNSVAPGKRPLSSMSPTIVLKNGEPVLTLGAAGGPTIITQTVMTIVRCLDLGMNLDEALAAPRFHQQWSPDQLYVEISFPQSLRKELQRRGHSFYEVSPIATVQALARGADGKSLLGAHDPRVPGKAIGF